MTCTELMGFLNSSLPFYVNLAEELQLLSGDGTGENLHGLIPQAAPFTPSLLPAVYNRIDAIGAAVEQIMVAKELMPTFCHFASERLVGACGSRKIRLGRYLLGGAQSNVTQTLFDLDVVATTSIAKGQFLVGNGTATAC